MYRIGGALTVAACIGLAPAAIADPLQPGDAASPGAPGANPTGEHADAPVPSADFPGRVGEWLSSPSGNALLRVPAAPAPSPQTQLVLVPLPPSLYAGLATLGALAGVNYMRRRRVQQP